MIRRPAAGCNLRSVRRLPDLTVDLPCVAGGRNAQQTIKVGAHAKLLFMSPICLIGDGAGEDDAEGLLRNNAVDRDPHGRTVAVLRT